MDYMHVIVLFDIDLSISVAWLRLLNAPFFH